MSGPPKLALVEDNPDNRLLLEALLEDDYELSQYVSGAAALSGIANAPPDLVLLDISLPGLDGTEVLKRLRAIPKLAQIPIIALTAHAMAGDRGKYLALGFDDYVSKPIVDEQVLFDAIAQLLALAPSSMTRKRERVRQRYLERMPSKIGALIELRERILDTTFDESALRQLTDLAHNLRGSGGSYGFPEITTAAAVLEQAKAGERLGAVDTLIAVLDKTVTAFKV